MITPLKDIKENASTEMIRVFRKIYDYVSQNTGYYLGGEIEGDGSLQDFSEAVFIRDDDDMAMHHEATRILEEAIGDIQNGAFSSLDFHINYFQNIAVEYGLDIDEYVERFEKCNDLLSIESVDILYTIKENKIIVPELIIPVKKYFLEKLKRNINFIYELTPRDFEELIAELFYKQGYNVELTKETRDGGKDIIAISRRFDIPIKLIIECKRYAKGRNVGLEYVQRLLGVKIAERANKAILVTTSSYSKDATSFASSHFWDLSLKDINDIHKWVKAT